MILESIEDVETIAVVGAGQMGRGISAVAALAGYDTTLQDTDSKQLETARERVEWSYEKVWERDEATEAETEAAIDRLTFTEAVEAAASADVVIEAVVEQQEVKHDIFQTIDDLAPPETIITTNTSGLNVTALAEATGRPSQVAGAHWFRPPMLMDLVEIVVTEHTSEATVEVLEDLIGDFDKTTIRCRRDIPNFIVNRCMRPYGEAAAWLVYYGEAEIMEVDAAMKYRKGFPMGPFELADYTGGIQIRVESEEDHLKDPRPLSYDTRRCPLLHKRYEQGHYGRKAGKGFYDYTDQDEPDINPGVGEDFDVINLWAPVINEAAKMVQHDVATVEDVDTGMRLGGNWPIGPLEKADEVGVETVVRTCVDHAAMHERIENLAEVLPCDLLVEKAKAGETFY